MQIRKPNLVYISIHVTVISLSLFGDVVNPHIGLEFVAATVK